MIQNQADIFRVEVIKHRVAKHFLIIPFAKCDSNEIPNNDFSG